MTFRISMDIDVYEVSDRDNQDGTTDKIYKTKNSGIVEIVKNGGKIIKAELRSSQSQKLHSVLYFDHQSNPKYPEFNDHYNHYLQGLRAFWPEIREQLDYLMK